MREGAVADEIRRRSMFALFHIHRAPSFRAARPLQHWRGGKVKHDQRNDAKGGVMTIRRQNSPFGTRNVKRGSAGQYLNLTERGLSQAAARWIGKRRVMFFHGWPIGTRCELGQLAL